MHVNVLLQYMMQMVRLNLRNNYNYILINIFQLFNFNN